MYANRRAIENALEAKGYYVVQLRYSNGRGWEVQLAGPTSPSTWWEYLGPHAVAVMEFLTENLKDAHE